MILSKKTNHGGLGHLSALDFRSLPAKKWEEQHKLAKARAQNDAVKRRCEEIMRTWPFPSMSENH